MLIPVWDLVRDQTVNEQRSPKATWSSNYMHGAETRAYLAPFIEGYNLSDDDQAELFIRRC